MCGFAGFITVPTARADQLAGEVERMTATIVHRGPDDAGQWIDADAGVGLGFRRLAIIDLSELGHQPMPSASGRFTIVFNGEVFNHRALRAELEATGARFRGHSDTEVILAAFEHWGIEAAVPRFIGMFAIAVWDARARALTLVRDRLGIKPLYVHQSPGWIGFGSELKALAAHPRFDSALDVAALAAFFRHLYVPGPQTIYRHVRKLPPGHLVTITDPAMPLPASRAYWSLDAVARAGVGDRFRGSDKEAVDALHDLLGDAVALRMEADVPLGAFLSGGIDSSTVVSLMQARSARPVRTFSIAFDSREHDEAAHAAAIARHLGTEHTELPVTGQDALAMVERLPEIFDEPFADTSQIPMMLVCAAARRHVTVALSGDGGDELFGGYNRYVEGERIVGRAVRLPRSARRLLGAGIGALSAESWDRLHHSVAPMLPGRLRHRLPGEKMAKLGRLLTADHEAQMYRSLLSAWQEPGMLLGGVDEAPTPIAEVLGRRWPARLAERMMLADQRTYLTEDGLVKVDRASMAVSLEARVPLLDHRVVEFSWGLPAEMKIRDGVTKWVLRQVLYRHVPRSLVDRPKMGFTVPLATWLNGALRPWAEELLSEDRLRADGLLAVAPVRDAWRRFTAGGHDLALPLWSVLMFQAWRQRWIA